MSCYGEKARAMHDDAEMKMNCAQGVFCALAEDCGVDKEQARRIAACFGGGGRCGEICGAVCGALMALGASGDGNGKVGAPSAGMAEVVTADFREEFGALRCEDLKAKYGKEKCGEFIIFSADKAAEMLELVKK